MRLSLALAIWVFTLFYSSTEAQTNILLTSSEAESILLSNYNPANYNQTNPLLDPHLMARGIYNQISPDSLKLYLVKLASFGNRNTGSDTVSNSWGIGAARRWVHAKFEEFKASSNNRLVPSYLQFDQAICNVGRHSNIMAILPGSDTTQKDFILIEGHIDSRCEGRCDSLCVAQGVEDNASGTALVMELARVMSKYQFEKTTVFMVTTGEEQGLLGANAFATFCSNRNLDIKCVLNNDVIGGVLCGQTSSAPSCPQPDHIDSTQVRLFSFGGTNSKHKQLVRFIKLEYKEEIMPFAAVPMTLTIMSREDRVGRGGDHIPFRNMGFTSMRFTAANEHGNGAPGPGYMDRQHSHRDTLGVDTNGDGMIDSFFVNFSYLKRNAGINGLAACMASQGPEQIGISAISYWGGRSIVNITDPNNYLNYRIAVRSTTLDFDTLINLKGSLTDTIDLTSPGINYISVCSVDSNGVESFFSSEILLLANVGVKELEDQKGVYLMQNIPNPFDESTIISYYIDNTLNKKNAWIVIRDLSGKLIERMPAPLEKGINEIIYDHGYGVEGTFIYSIIIDDEIISSKKMQFNF